MTVEHNVSEVIGPLNHQAPAVGSISKDKCNGLHMNVVSRTRETYCVTKYAYQVSQIHYRRSSVSWL